MRPVGPHWLPTARRVERSCLIVLCISVFVFLGIGSAWDHHWHTKVGRDALISPPHVVMYLGVVLGGVAAGIAAVLVTIFPRTTSSAPARAISLPERRMGVVPLGYRVALAGAAAMVVAAVFDEIWHRTIGDRTIWSPPHVMGVLGGVIVGAGAVQALFEASRDGLLPRAVGEAMRKGFPATLLVAAYFGVLPAAALAFAPTRGHYAFFSLTNPYIVAAIAALLVPPLVGIASSPGAGGWRLTVGVGVGLWLVQEVLPLAITPLAALMFHYRLRPNPFPDFWFEAIALIFMIAPALVTAPLIVRRPWLGGAMCGLGYAAAVGIGLALADLDLRLSVVAVMGPVTLGLIGGPVGVSVGRWLHR